MIICQHLAPMTVNYCSFPTDQLTSCLADCLTDPQTKPESCSVSQTVTNIAKQTITMSLTASRYTVRHISERSDKGQLKNSDMRSGRHLLFWLSVSYFLCFEHQVFDQDSESAFWRFILTVCLAHTGSC